MPERARTRHLGGGASGAFTDASYAALGACVTGGACSSAGLLLGVARATNPKSRAYRSVAPSSAATRAPRRSAASADSLPGTTESRVRRAWRTASCSREHERAGDAAPLAEQALHDR